MVAYDNLHRLPEQLRRELAKRVLADYTRQHAQAAQPLLEGVGTSRDTPSHHSCQER